MRFVDLTGNRVGRWLVIRQDCQHKSYWICCCDCGQEKSVRGAHLSAGTTQSCGCFKSEQAHATRIDLTGKVFGRWMVLGPDLKRNRYWICRCSCGKEKSVHAVSFQHKKGAVSLSCGCLKKELARERAKYNGEAADDTPEFRTWRKMKERCFNQKDRAYLNYGGRGITICERWLKGNGTFNGYQCFLLDMGRRPSPRHSIDRKENDGNYEPENCRWVTALEQSRNRRSNVKVLIAGQEILITDALKDVKNGRHLFKYYRRRYRLTNQEAYERVLSRCDQREKI